MMDPEGTITTWNAGVFRNLGYNEEEFIGMNVSNIFAPEDVAAGAAERERAVAIRDGCSPDERWHVRKDGSRLFVDGVLCAIRDEVGQLVGFSKVMRDATRRKLTEEALGQSNRELSHFAHVVSHDLQAPLRAIAVYTDLLTKRDVPSSEAVKYASFIQDGVARMQKLIQDLLEYAQASQRTPKHELVDLESAVAQAQKNHQAFMNEAGATITHDPLPTIPADETSILQLFQNLLGNALKYRSTKPPRIHISAVRDGDRWRVSVEDNGIGIDPKYQQQIFEPFHRLHGNKSPGTGMGLAICKRIVERYGGRIWVESRPGVGSTFYFTL